MVYVLNKYGKPLMPTTRFGKVRRLLKNGLAIVVQHRPFTIQLTYDVSNGIQIVSLGIDPGSKHIGLSATSDTRVYFEAQIDLRTDIVTKLATRREYRWGRRHRTTRYRPARFDNRGGNNKHGWISPSIKHKIDCHIKWVHTICKILPISHIYMEMAPFDVSKLPDKLDDTGLDKLVFHNVREYVLFRDGHQCQACHGKERNVKLNVHHIESRKTGGNSSNNLITLCETCHKKYHRGQLSLPATIKRSKSMRDAAYMNIMRNALFMEVQRLCGDSISCSQTYGYITKMRRQQYKLPKTHIIDARCISGHPLASTCGKSFIIRKIRVNNRQIHRASIGKNGNRKRNQAAYEVYGFRLMDSVIYNGQLCYVAGRRTNGAFALSDVYGNSITNSISYKKLILANHNSSYIIYR